MKTLILIGFLAFIHPAGRAQEPTFPIADAKWVVHLVKNLCIGGTNRNIYWTEFLEGDTLIGDKTYSKVMLSPQCVYDNAGSHCPEYFEYPDDGINVIGGIREDSGKVVFRRFNVDDSLFSRYDPGVRNIQPDKEIVIYDLNWVDGDSIYYPREGGDSLLYHVIVDFHNGKKRFGLQPPTEQAWQVFSTIEGMGGERGLFSMYYHNLATIVTMCFFREDDLIYGENCGNNCQTVSTSMLAEELLQIYPNPAVENFFIGVKYSEGPYILRIFNISGELVFMDKTFLGNTHIQIQDSGLHGLHHVLLTDINGRTRFGNVFVY